MATLLRSLRRPSDAAPTSPASDRSTAALAKDADARNPPKRWNSLPSLLAPKRGAKAKRDTQQQYPRTGVLVNVSSGEQGTTGSFDAAQATQQQATTPPLAAQRTQSPASSSRARPASLAHRARGSMKSAILGVRAALALSKYAKHADASAADDEAIAAEERAEPPPRITVALESEEAGGASADVSLADACLLVSAHTAEQLNQQHALPYPGYGMMKRSDSALVTSTAGYTASVAGGARHLYPLADETADDVTPLTSPRYAPRGLLPRSTSHPAQLAPPRSRSATGAPLAFAVAASRAASRAHSRVPSGAPLLETPSDEPAAAVAHAAAWARAYAPLFADAGVPRAAAAASRVPSPRLHEQEMDWDWRAAAEAMPELASSPPPSVLAEGAKVKAKEAETSPVREGSQRTLSAAGTLLPSYAPLPPPMPPAYQPVDAGAGGHGPQRDEDA